MCVSTSPHDVVHVTRTLLLEESSKNNHIDALSEYIW